MQRLKTYEILLQVFASYYQKIFPEDDKGGETQMT